MNVFCNPLCNFAVRVRRSVWVCLCLLVTFSSHTLKRNASLWASCTFSFLHTQCLSFCFSTERLLQLSLTGRAVPASDHHTRGSTPSGTSKQLVFSLYDTYDEDINHQSSSSEWVYILFTLWERKTPIRPPSWRNPPSPTPLWPLPRHPSHQLLPDYRISHRSCAIC